jgi:hypothetical protein
MSFTLYNCDHTITPIDINNSKDSKIWFMTEWVTHQSGTIAFTVHYEGLTTAYQGGEIQLHITNESGTETIDPWTAGTTTSGEHTFYRSLSDGNYTYYASMDCNTSSKYSSLYTGNVIKLTVSGTNNQFYYKISEVLMQHENDNDTYKIWKSYKSGTYTYDGLNHLNAAFNAANTYLNINYRTDWDPLKYTKPENLATVESIYQMSFVALKGDHNNQNGYGLDINSSIIVAVDDVTYSPNNGDPAGISWPRIENTSGSLDSPSLSIVLVGKIERVAPTDEFYKVYQTVGAGIHELGHARGIWDVDHGGHEEPNSMVCIMWKEPGYNNLTNPLFCGGHINYLKTVTW